MKLINKFVTGLEVPGTRQFSNKVALYDNCIDLTLGQSGFAPADYIKDAMIRAISEDQLRYTHNKGLLELRQAVSDDIYRRLGVRYDAETEILMTNGGSEAIDDVLRTIINPDDEVLLPVPTYLGYEPVIKLLGAKTVYVDTTQTGFVPTPEAVTAAITDKTKAIIFNYPTNPTGVTYTYDQIQALADALSETSIFIITDEIYSENVYDAPHHSFMEFKDVRNQLFVVSGLSKSHAITGARVGYVLAPEALMEHVTTVHLYNSICVATPMQYGAISALNHGQEDVTKMNDAYIERRNYLYDRLIGMGLPVIKPQGAFYIFPDISAYSNDSFQFANDLIEQEQLAVVPGKSFSDLGEGYIRLSFACTMEEIIEACDRLERFLNHYQQ
ncbi:aminotransferase class I/II-fold pyridoxal phosphate-dependent enzyme [Macrococcus brunensis]|uniref:Aminotransferase n=1 Tax=Macrococcus brunensis TaxID=198483 RepID=A0A4R6BAT3_9STAP|nr:aminotransferase class I/II-fold pyridoxal phosphate-dependent enzyme [Macrococcus brunensis]TDL93418.1 aminotransferase class I/II-fold pyridoxal phosphate-dependent enzyme [Macrococcus brunensis]